MKKFKEYIKENKNDLDPYNEENWDDDQKFFVIESQEQHKIVFVATKVKNENEAKKQFTDETGVTDEYGKLRISEIHQEEILAILERRRHRQTILNNELEKLDEEIQSLEEANERNKR